MGEADLAMARDRAAEEQDAALARALGKQTREACVRFYDRFASAVHRFAVTRLSGDVEAAEEIVVETMVAAVSDIARYDPRRSSLSAWVFGIARRRVLMEVRRQRRHRSVPPWARVPLDSAHDQEHRDDPAAAAASRLEAGRKVAELRRVLSEQEFEVLAFFYVERLSARDISRAIGRSERAVHSILHRARRKARERLMADE